MPLNILSEKANNLLQSSPEIGSSNDTENGSERRLRTSSYTIYVDLPGNPEEMLLVHGYTGTYDKVSRRVATYVRSLELRRAPKPLYGDWTPEPAVDGQVSVPSDHTIQILRRRGYLTEMFAEEEEEVFEKIVGRLHEKNLRQVPSYMIMPTYNCNLRCAYCFQDHMRTDSRYDHLLRLIDRSTVDRIFAAIPKIEEMHGLEHDGNRHRNIGLFGGEPLLESSRPMVDYIVGRARAIGTASFWAVTNATDLHVYEDLLSPETINNIQVTIDGPRSEHDRRRIYADGSGSYERIVRNVEIALARGVRVSIRLNIDRHNIGNLPALARDFLDRGWDKRSSLSIYAAPIRATNEKTDSKSTFDTWELDQALLEMCEENSDIRIIGRPDSAIRSQSRRLFKEPEDFVPNFRESFCSAHSRLYIFDAFSDIYACWDHTGDPTVRIGSLREDGAVTINMPVNDLWRSRTVASNPACRRCRYALHCGGGCAVFALGRTGRLHSNFCDGFASRFRASVAEGYIEFMSGQESVDGGASPCEQ